MVVFLNEVISEWNKLTTDLLYFDMNALRASDMRELGVFVKSIWDMGVLNEVDVKEMIGIDNNK